MHLYCHVTENNNIIWPCPQLLNLSSIFYDWTPGNTKNEYKPSLVPVVLSKREKKRGCSTRLGPRCDVTAKGASERLADFSIFNMAENLDIQITL